MQPTNSSTSEKKVHQKKLQPVDKQFFNELLSFQYDKEDDEDYTISCRPKVRSKRISKAQRLEREGLYLRAKFRFIASIDQVSDASIYSSKTQFPWEKVSQVLYPSQEGEVTCPICMNEENQIIAPQITPCGHIFCWHCYLRHEDISDTRSYCPLCGEFAPYMELRSVKLFLRPKNTEQITFLLLVRQEGSEVLYNVETQQEDSRFSKILIAQNSYILSEILLKERQMLQIALTESVSAGEDWDIPYINQALEINEKKIALYEKKKESDAPVLADEIEIKKGFKKKKISKQGDNVTQSFILKSLSDDNKNAKLNYFYQEESGSLTYLNPINYRNLLIDKKEGKDLPLQISSKLIAQQNACVDQNFLKRQPYLKHLPPFSDIIFAEIDMSTLLNPETAKQNDQELSIIHKKLKEKEEREAKKMLKNIKPSDDPYGLFFDREYCIMNGLIIMPPQNLKIEEKHYPQLEVNKKEEQNTQNQQSQQRKDDSEEDDYVIISKNGQLPRNYVNKKSRQKFRELENQNLFPQLEGAKVSKEETIIEKSASVELVNNESKIQLTTDKQSSDKYEIIEEQDSKQNLKEQNISNQWEQIDDGAQETSNKTSTKVNNISKSKKNKKIIMDGNFFH